MTALAPHLVAFMRDYLPCERGCSEHTCAAYAYTFQLLLRFAAQRLHGPPSSLALEQIDAPLVIAFLEHLEDDRGNGVSTRNARLAAIKSFAHFLEYREPSCLEQVGGILAIPSKRTRQALINHLERDEIQALLDAPDPSTRVGTRDRAMLHVAFAAGLRVSELIGLQMDDLRTHPQASLHVRGKGRRERVLPLWKQTAKFTPGLGRDSRGASCHGDLPEGLPSFGWVTEGSESSVLRARRCCGRGLGRDGSLSDMLAEWHTKRSPPTGLS